MRALLFLAVLVVLIVLPLKLWAPRVGGGAKAPVEFDRFVDVLPDPPRRLRAAPARDRVDTEGYEIGSHGSRMAVYRWSLQPAKTDDEHDLVALVSCYPMPGDARKSFEVDVRETLISLDRLFERATPQPPLRADESLLLRRRATADRVMLAERHGSCLFRFNARVAEGGHFPTEAAAIDMLRTLDGHIHGLLAAAK